MRSSGVTEALYCATSASVGSLRTQPPGSAAQALSNSMPATEAALDPRELRAEKGKIDNKKPSFIFFLRSPSFRGSLNWFIARERVDQPLSYAWEPL